MPSLQDLRQESVDGYSALLVDQIAPIANALKTITVTNPGAGLDWSASVPVGKAWKVKSLRGLFTTSAAATTRFPWFQIKDASANVLQTLSCSTTSTTATNGGWTFQIGTVVRSSVSDLILPTGYSISSLTVSIDVADVWSAIRLWVVEVPLT